MNLPATVTITFLFSDLEGSTQLWERFPEAMKIALKRHDAILRAAIEGSGGRVVKTTGDGMMAVFGSAADAATASLAAQRDLTAEAWAETGPLRVRMGLHAGQAEERAGDYFGPTVNRTARIMAAGHGGQVLLSASAAALAREGLPDGASLLDLGEHRLKDLGRPEQVFQLVHPDLPAVFPPLAAGQLARANVPARVAELIGRRAELDEIKRRLEDPSVRLLTLIGPGGTGKTTLALRAAEELAPRFPDGVSFVDLSSARDTGAVLVAIARAVGLDDVVDRPLQDELADRLSGRQVLLVLDNLEQVTEAAGALAELLSACSLLKMMATSREALHIRAEHVYPVPPLGLPPSGGVVSAAQAGGYEAVQLFIDRARAVRPDFRLTDENAPAVAEICRRLDGLPLALELAAARLRLFSPDVLRDRLTDRLGLLRSGPRDLPERQQTLRATMDWSYELLEPGEKRLFEFLAVFADAEVAAIEVVAADVDAAAAADADAAGDADAIDRAELDVLEGLAGLAEKSLVRLIEPPGGEPRVTMLETIREFAADRLGGRPGFLARSRRAHAAHFADLARRSRAEMTGNERETALATIDADVANLRIAWAYWVGERDLERLDDLAGTLLILDDAHGWYLDTVGLTTDMLAVLAAVPSSRERIGQEIALRTTLARALMATKGFTPEVEAAFASVLELFEGGADVRQHFSVLRGLASLYVFRGQLEESARLGQEILALGERERDPAMLIDGHLLVGATLMTYDALRAGLDHFDQAISLFPARPARSQSARVRNDPCVSTLTTSGLTLWMLGYPDRAAERADAALTLAAELEHPFSSAYARFHAGLLRLWRRDTGIALDLAAGLVELADEHEFRIWTAAGTCLLGAAQVDAGQFEDGLARIRSGIGLYGELRSPPIFWPFLLYLDAAASGRAGRPGDGLRALDPAIEIMSAGRGVSILPELHILKGDLVAALPADEGGGSSAAERWYRLALDRAGELDARMAQLRAATRLARLHVAADEPDAAARLLGPVYDTFTEGFATADLLEAQELLAAVAPDRSPRA